MKPQDQHARDAALDITRSLAVSAPAGSGKTGLLTLRVLKLLTLCERPENILAITFTRKAAGEMHERIFSNLLQAQSLLQQHQYRTVDALNAVTDDYQRLAMEQAMAALKRSDELGWELLHNPHRLRIMTIDGFCRELANQLPVVSGAGVGTAIVDNPALLYDEAIRSLLDSYRQGHFSGPLNHVLSHLDNNIDRLCELLGSMLGNREQWLPMLLAAGDNGQVTTGILEQNLGEWADELVKDICRDLGVFAGELLDHARFAAGNLSESPIARLQDCYELAGASFLDIREFWQPLTELLLTGTGGWRRTFNKNTGFPSSKDKDENALIKERKASLLNIIGELSEINGLQQNLQKIARFPAHGYSQQDRSTLDALFQLLPAMVAHLNIVQARSAQTDFTEVMLAALRALGDEGEPTDLSLALDYRIQHILVDEFQDTSSTQLELLNRLTQGWMPEDGRTLFVVGDAMQSCYGFRNANVGIFLKVRESGLENLALEPVDLTVNFRSNRVVVDWVNEVFNPCFPAANDINSGAVSYKPSAAFDNQPSPQAGVNCKAFAGDHANRAEAEYIINEIAKLRQTHPDDSVCVLVRSRPHLRDIIAALTEQQIPFQAVDIDPLQARPVIQDLISLLRLLLDQSDHNAWLAVLRSPFVGLQLADLTRLVGDYAPADTRPDPVWRRIHTTSVLATLSDESRERVNRIVPSLLKAIDQVGRVPIARVLESLWHWLGGHRILKEDAQLRDVRTFFSLVQRHSQSGRIAHWQSFVTDLGKLYAEPAQWSAAQNPVQIMTMHKSKGLEFDSVFVAGLNRKPRGDDAPVMFWLERIAESGEPHALLSPISPSDREKKTPLHEFFAEENKIKGRFEDTRLLYVACTRARKRLWLTGCLKLKEGEPQKPADNTMLARIWPAVESGFLSGLHTTPDTGSEGPAPLQPFVQFRLANNDLAAPLPDGLNEQPGETFDNEGARLIRTEDRRSAAMGTVLHRILQRACETGRSLQTLASDSQQQAIWRVQLRQAGVAQADTSSLVSELVSTLERLNRCDTIQWLLDKGHQHSTCEWVLHYGGQPRTAVIDRFFVDRGTAWIVDYKSSRPLADETAEQFAERQREEYQPQLERYRQLVGEYFAGRYPIRTALLLTHNGQFVELAEPQPQNLSLFD